MQHSRQLLGAFGNARAGHPNRASGQQVNAAGPNGGQARQLLPDRNFGGARRLGGNVGGAQFEDHLWRPRENHFARGLHGLGGDVREYIVAARRLEDVVQEPAPAAGVDVSQRSAFAAEDKQRAGFLQPTRLLAESGQAAINLPCDRIGLLRMTGALSQRPDGGRHCREPTMAIFEIRDRGA